MSDDLAFSGLKVLDFSQGVAGPHCGMLLAQHGAAVTKLARPIAELMASVARGMWVHAFDDGVAREHLGELRRQRRRLVEVEQRGNLGGVCNERARAGGRW